MMAQSRAESTWKINNNGKYINQFLPNSIKSIRQYERINKKICRQKMSIMFNEICINEEMLAKCIYLYILPWNVSDWFTIGECNKLLISTLLPLRIARKTPSVLLVLGQTIFYFGMPFNQKRTGKFMSQGFLNKLKMKTKWNA